MKKKFKLFTLLAVIFCFAGILAITANAETCGDLTYEVANGEVTITHCNRSVSGTLVLPESIDNCPVMYISDAAFNSCENLTNVIIPDSVTAIGDIAFGYCNSLTNIVIPDSIVSIGDEVFYWCNSLTSITIPDSITSIGNRSFYCCTNLSDVTIPDSVCSIGYQAFFCCENLKELTIPDSVMSIGANAFLDCKSLETIYAPIHLKATESEWLGNCTATVIYRYPHTVQITNATATENSLKFITKMETTAEEPAIASFGTRFVPLWLYDNEDAAYVEVTYSNADHNITSGQTFGAAVANIPASCKDMDIVAKSFLEFADGSRVWSEPMYARLSDCTLKESDNNL